MPVFEDRSIPGSEEVCFEKVRSENRQKMNSSGLAGPFVVEEAERGDSGDRWYCCRTCFVSSVQVSRSTEISKNKQVSVVMYR